MEDKDFIPIEKLNTRVEVYEEPSTKEKLGALKQKGKDKVAIYKKRYEEAAPKREAAKNFIKGLFSQENKGFGGKVKSRIEARSKRPLSYQSDNIFTKASINNENIFRNANSDSNNIYRGGSGNNPYSFLNSKKGIKKRR